MLPEALTSRLIELAVNNLASLLLGALISAWFILVRLRVDDQVRDALELLHRIDSKLNGGDHHENR